MGTVRYTVLDGEILSETRSGVIRDYVPDALGSTVALLDNTQTQTDTFTYWPYGETNVHTGSNVTPCQYVGTLGYYQDSASKTYVRARHLDTLKGRWVTTDPIGFLGGDANLYRYVNNSPVTLYDLSGLTWSWIDAAAGCLFGALGSALGSRMNNSPSNSKSEACQLICNCILNGLIAGISLELGPIAAGLISGGLSGAVSNACDQGCMKAFDPCDYKGFNWCDFALSIGAGILSGLGLGWLQKEIGIVPKGLNPKAKVGPINVGSHLGGLNGLGGATAGAIASC